MGLFIIFTQALSVMTSLILWWFYQPKAQRIKWLLVVSIFVVNNGFILYGLSEFWGERFNVYLVVGILQGFMLYAALISAAWALSFRLLFRGSLGHKLIRRLALVVYIGMVSVAVFNAYSPVVRHLTVSTAKPLDKPIDIALVSDTHWGRWFGNRQIDKLVSLIDEQNPDVVVMAGDIMHDTTIAYDKSNMQERLAKLKAPLGVYATLGNHDYRGYDERISAAVKDAGIIELDNTSVLLDESVWLIGRSDDVDRTRLSAEQLLAAADTDQPIVFLEHRPTAFEEIAGLPIDLHLSGHTHGGQIFPLTLLMAWFEPLIYGNQRIQNTEFLVTSGYGIGAVPFRLGTRSEIWIVHLQSGS